MSTILVTPKGEPVWAYNHTINDGTDKRNIITFPKLERWEAVDVKVARVRGVNRIAPSDFEERIVAYQRGELVNLAGNGQLRLGVGVIPIVNGRLALRQFDATHPTRPEHLSPPAGLFESGDPWESAWSELCEELIPVGPEGVGLYYNQTHNPLEERGRLFAMEHGLCFSGEKVCVEPPTQYSFDPNPKPAVRFGNYGMNAVIEFEPDTSSIELLFPVKIDLPDGWTIMDGEQLPDGSWCDQPIWLSPPLTTKAKLAVATFG